MKVLIRMPRYSTSELIASTHAGFVWKNDSRIIVIDFMDDRDIDPLLDQLHADPRRRLSLHFEKIRGFDQFPVIDIYLNLKERNRPKEKNYVGSMGLYGLPESSAESSEHDGYGQDRVFDVGPVFRKLRSQSNWSARQFTLSLLPNRAAPVDASFTIGRIALYFHTS